MTTIARWLRHLLTDRFALRRAFPRSTLQAIEAEVRAQERRHRGELRVVVESSMPFVDVLRGVTPRRRAGEVFTRFRVWDTEDNSGVLVYLLLADRDVEIIADRGLAARVPQAGWDRVARAMEGAFRAGEFERGALAGVRAIGDLLATHFPRHPGDTNELPDAPVVR
jgi:uncharacterized membrane protein